VSCLCLSIHADFLCRHSGACCTSGWPIHVEADRLTALRDALGAGRLTFDPDRADDPSPFVEPSGLPPDAGAVLRTCASGACVFYERDGGLCAIQRTLGHDHLPSACQHFPRRCLIEPDRIALSLSHYCPTVARLTFGPAIPPDIVPAPASLVGHVALEGLDAREALPPLVRPGILADLTGYRAWERFVIEILATPGAPEAALAEISAFTERVRVWTPRDGDLREAVERAGPMGGSSPVEISRWQDEGQRAAQLAGDCEVVRASVPAGILTKPAPDRLDAIDARWVANAWPQFSQPLRNFIAAHAFGNWCAYHGMGLRTVVRSLVVALAVVRVEAARLCATSERPLDEPLLLEAMRQADLLLVHLADPKALTARLSDVEQAQ
jgi:Fe-S-cluster containining protein